MWELVPLPQGPQADLNLGIEAVADGGATTTPDQIQIDTTQPATQTNPATSNIPLTKPEITAQPGHQHPAACPVFETHSRPPRRPKSIASPSNFRDAPVQNR
jgi:hypothetical protein